MTKDVWSWMERPQKSKRKERVVMKKQQFIKDIGFGVKVTKEAFQVKECFDKKGEFHFSVSDRTGTMDAVLTEVTQEVVELIRSKLNGVFLVDGVVINAPVEGSAPVKQMKVTGIVLADASSYNVNEVYGGISEEMKQFHINLIKQEKDKRIVDMQLKALVDALITDENLEKLALLPVTIADYGCYVGGALVATNQITGLAIQMAGVCFKRGNGIYATETDFSMVTTAALLTQIGKIEFFSAENPFEKSSRGVILNYFPLLQNLIYQTILKNNLIIDEVKLDTLINILNVSLTHSDTACASKEAVIVSEAVSYFRKMDLYEAGFLTCEFGEGDSFKPYAYKEKGNYYYLAPGAEGGVL